MWSGALTVLTIKRRESRVSGLCDFGDKIDAGLGSVAEDVKREDNTG